LNPTRVHVLTHLSPTYDAMRNPETDFGLEEAAMKQLDDNVGVVLNWLKAKGLDENTIVVFTTDNGAEVYTWPDGGTTPFAGAKGEVTEANGIFTQPFFSSGLCRCIRERASEPRRRDSQGKGR
jgi:arylsulfatase A-like enzyme